MTDQSPDDVHIDVFGCMQLRDLDMERRNPRTVVAVILGGGAGTRLFPLTKRRAKPAVSLILAKLQ